MLLCCVSLQIGSFPNCRIYTKLGQVHHVRLTRSQSALFIPKILVFQFKMAAVSLMRGFSSLQFVVLGRKTQVFNTVNQKNDF